MSEKTPLLETDGKKGERKNENDNACNKRRNEPDYDKQGKKKKTVHQKNKIHEKNQKNLLQSLHHAKHDWTWLLNGGNHCIPHRNCRSNSRWGISIYSSDVNGTWNLHFLCERVRVLMEKESRTEKRMKNS